MRRALAAGACLVAAWAVGGSTQRIDGETAWPVTLRDIAATAGLTVPSMYGPQDSKRLILETNGSGVAFLDYDRDGFVDAFVLSGTRLKAGTRTVDTFAKGQEPRNRLYRNRQNGTFVDVTATMSTGPSGWASGICAGDYDNDGWSDVFLTYYGQNALLRNADGTFEDVTARSGLASARARWGSGCTFLDYDRDGDLDLFVANYLVLDLAHVPDPGEGPNCLWKGIPVNCGPKGLPTDTNILYRNNGDGSFTDVSVPSGVASVTGRYPMTAAAADFDGDGWTDIYVASDSTAAILYRNNRDGTFSDVALESGAAYNEDGNAQAGMGLAISDYNGDGILDILKTHFADDVPALYRGLGRLLFQDVATSSGLSAQNRYVQWGAGMPDLDNDGLPDLICMTGSVYPEVEKRLPEYPYRGPRIVFRNIDGNRFEDVTTMSGPGATDRHSSRGAAFGDFDNDGDVDVLVMNMNEAPSLLRNEYSGGNAWIEVALEGTKSNRSAIGATVLVTSGGRTQAHAVLSQSSYYSHDDLRQHFGLHQATKVESVEVRWPSGLVSRLKDVPVRRVVRIKESS